MSIIELKKLCKERSIDYSFLQKNAQNDSAKNILVGVLEAYDEEIKVLTPPTPKLKDKNLKNLDHTHLILNKPYIAEDEIVLEEEDDVAEITQKILAIGISKDKDVIINRKNFLYTGEKDKEDILWENIKNQKPNSFDRVIIFDFSPFIIEENSNNVLPLLKENGELWVVKNSLEYRKGFIKFLNKEKFSKSSETFIYVDCKKQEFDIFKVGGVFKVLEKDSRDFPKETSLELLEEEDVPKKPIRPPGQYKKYKIKDVYFSKKDTTPSEGRSSSVSITFDEFLEESKKDEFISSFTFSIENLMKYKLKFYRVKITELKKEFEKVKKKVNELLKNGVCASTIKEKYPMYDFYACFILDLEDIVMSIIEKLRTINKSQVKKNLIESIENQEKGLNSLVSRIEIKNNIACQLYAFSKSHKTFTNSFNNIALLGNAGSGKTHTAKVISYVFSKSGILATDTVKIVSRTDLVGQYVGQTAPRTQSILFQTLEGILFIDEAYQLAPVDEKSNDYGSESITEIVNFVDKYIGMNMVIVAGYENIMISRFFKCNEGLPRRFPYRIILRDYTLSELCDILLRVLDSKDIDLTDEKIPNYLYSLLFFLSKEKSDVFCNQAGDMLNLGSSIEKCIHASYKIKWGPLKNNIPIIKEGFLKFLDTKGYEIIDISMNE